MHPEQYIRMNEPLLWQQSENLPPRVWEDICDKMTSGQKHTILCSLDNGKTIGIIFGESVTMEGIGSVRQLTPQEMYDLSYSSVEDVLDMEDIWNNDIRLHRPTRTLREMQACSLCTKVFDKGSFCLYCDTVNRVCVEDVDGDSDVFEWD